MSRLSTKQRKALYESEVAKAKELGLGERPICNICCFPIVPPGRWHASHNPHLPRALGGLIDGIAHERCNLEHAHKVDVPLISKVKRIRDKFHDLKRPRRPMPGGKNDPRKRTMSGVVVNRVTGEPWR